MSIESPNTNIEANNFTPAKGLPEHLEDFAQEGKIFRAHADKSLQTLCGMTDSSILRTVARGDTR